MSSSIDEAVGGGFRSILVATVVAGVGGFVITTVVARALGDDYTQFAVFWACLYLAIGTLSGAQQEVARGTRRADPRASGARPLPLALAIGMSVAAVALITSAWWGPAVFPEAPGLAIPIALGAGAYLPVAALWGVMYGHALWRPLSMSLILDPILRLALLAVGLLGGADVVALAWLTVVPLPLVALAAVLLTRASIVRGVTLDVGYGAAFANIARTVLAAAATSLLVSGFPLLIGVVGSQLSPTYLSALILALILTRAPLTVSTLALQSYLVVHFRDTSDVGARILRYTAILVLAAVVIAAAAWWVGEPLIVLVAGEVFRLPGSYLAALVLSSVPTALTAVTGAAVLARARHWYFSAGWVVAAVAATALMFVPEALGTRTLLALGLGPLCGVIVHVVGLRRERAAL